MITASELAGFVAAHAVLSLADADALTPMLAHTAGEDERRSMTRLAGDDPATAVADGRAQLEAGPPDANDAVLAYAARLSSPDGPLDAVVLEIRCYAFPGADAAIAVPFTPKSTGAFRVHQPILARWQGCEDFDVDTALQAFFHGVASHEKGAAVWDTALDESR